jgi:hypothetical protein
MEMFSMLSSCFPHIRVSPLRIGLALLMSLLAGCSGGGSGSPQPNPLSITTTDLPGGEVNSAYSVTLAAAGGLSPYSWTLASGTLPAGLTLDGSNGQITGKPAVPGGVSKLTFEVSDSSQPAQHATANLSLSVATPLDVTTQSLPSAVEGNAYNVDLAAAGGTAPYTWTLLNGTLPAGLAFNSITGVISGIPSASTSPTTLTLRITDSGDPVQTTTLTLTLSVAPPLVITTTSLPPGLIGQNYAASLAVSGGTPPVSWSLTGGTLPAGLTLSPAGMISGSPTAASTGGTSLTLTVTDSGSPAQTESVPLPLYLSPANISVSITPAQAGVTVTQPLNLSATSNDNAGVNWSVSPAGGSFSPSTSMSGVGVVFTPSAAPGVYTITATSVTSPKQAASATVGVTNLTGVYTYHNDLARDGANTQELALTPSNVNTNTFGRLFSCAVDGAIYAQPLWVANVIINGSAHNVVFVATAHDSLFAFDADAAPCKQLWQVSLIDANHGAQAAAESSIAQDPQVAPELGVTGTPVIDPATNILYVVSDSQNSTGTAIYQRLHAIDLATGNEKTGSPVTITFSDSGTATGGGTVAFDPQQQTQRAGLTLLNGAVYIAWASHEDLGTWFGWVASYTYAGGNFAPPVVFNVAPDASEGGIWMSGGAPAADDSGHLYLITGNGTLTAQNPMSPNTDYGDAFLQLSQTLAVTSWFSPNDQTIDYSNDRDFGSGGALLIGQPGTAIPHILVGGGKDGTLFVLNGDSMGGLAQDAANSNAIQNFFVQSGIFSTPAYWNNTLYLGTAGYYLVAYPFNPTTEMLATNFASGSPNIFGWPGTTPSISASGSNNGIVWALDTSANCIQPTHPSCGPAVLHAYDATQLTPELWNSSMEPSDAAGNAVKFAVPTLANGKVYVGTRGNNSGGGDSSSTVPGELDVYGLLP